MHLCWIIRGRVHPALKLLATSKGLRFNLSANGVKVTLQD